MRQLRGHRAQALNKLITSNKKDYFKQGKIIPEDKLCEWFNIETPASADYKAQQAYQLRKVTAYTTLNRLLAHRGMRIEARDYYSEFHVLTTEETIAAVERLQDKSSAQLRASQQLRRGVSTYRAKWTRLKDDEINS